MPQGFNSIAYLWGDYRGPDPFQISERPDKSAAARINGSYEGAAASQPNERQEKPALTRQRVDTVNLDSAREADDSGNLAIAKQTGHQDEDDAAWQTVFQEEQAAARQTDSSEEPPIAQKETKSKFQHIDFTSLSTTNISFTEPYSLLYFGKIYRERNWIELYAELCALLLKSHPIVFKRMRLESLAGKRKRWLVDAAHRRFLSVPKKIGEGFYIEAGKSRKDIIRNIKWLLDQCGVKYENVIITYRSKKLNEETGNIVQAAQSDEESTVNHENVTITYHSKKIDVEAGGTDQAAQESSRIDLDDELHSLVEKVLLTHFQRGFRLGSALETKKFLRRFEETYGGSQMPPEESLEKLIRETGIEHGGRVYAAQTMVARELRDKIFSYIEKKFEEGKAAIYFEAIFCLFREEFLDNNIYDADMLKSYLAHVNEGRYFVGKDCLSKNSNEAADPAQEIGHCLREEILPMTYEALSKALSHIPLELIRNTLRSNSEFIRNGKGEYFHVDSFSLTEGEIEGIARLIENEIDQNYFVSGNELYEMLILKPNKILAIS